MENELKNIVLMYRKSAKHFHRRPTASDFMSWLASTDPAKFHLFSIDVVEKELGSY